MSENYPTNPIRTRRKMRAWTQEKLAEESNLSLRTIQRIEAGESIPKGYTLSQLARVFDLDPAELRKEFETEENPENDSKLTLKLMNLSALSFAIFPFGNLVFPILIWRRNRSKSTLVDLKGRSIINFQILWSFCLCLALSVAPFTQGLFQISFPVILITLFVFVLLLGLGVVKIAQAIDDNRTQLLDLPIKFI